MKISTMVISQGAVFKGSERATTVRRVIGVISGRVLYSTGGNKNFSCSVATFVRWATSQIYESKQ